ncbi:helix-turn-helix domain-containing protein [Nocardioides sp.]|uniref:PucR family transcriptional regulator n=1 Tax=Nocardioides sp. TaxID=35761 RepID=UPI002C241BA6|nr:helix-turn-helix domain-containing protein [Nocardioides sp.]HSX68993.1 helix-turn-helix domain-containing protein [Nocardioides sp.]
MVRPLIVPPAAQAWLSEFVEEGLRPEAVDDFVRVVDDEILAAIPEIAGDPSLAEELDFSTREHWRNFLVGLSGDHRLALPPAAIALSLSIARRHLDINVLLKVYRVANRAVFAYITEHTEPGRLPAGLARDEALLALWLRAEKWIDDSIEQLIDHYTRERAALAEGAHARRAETIEALVSGALPTADTEAILGHRLTSWQTAFVLSASSTTDDSTVLFDIAVRVCQQLGLPRPLTTLAGSRELWAWVATPEEPSLRLDDAVDLLAGEGVHLAVGLSSRGPTAFRTSHVQALAAQRIGLRAPAAVHAYADIELVSLVGDGELARAMVRREIAPLLVDGRTEETLRTTALAYLRAGQNVDSAAECLFVHPNTVRYRLARVEALLDGRLASRAAQLEVALAWVATYGLEALQ